MIEQLESPRILAMGTNSIIRLEKYQSKIMLWFSAIWFQKIWSKISNYHEEINKLG